MIERHAVDVERERQIRGYRWIGYPRAQYVLQRLKQLMAQPKRHRMPNLLLVSDTGNGKTMIAGRFVERYPAQLNPEGESSELPVLMVQAPPAPDEGRFYNALLHGMYALFKEASRMDRRQFQVLAMMRLCDRAIRE